MIWALIASLAVVVYVIVAYPLILGWLAKLAPKPLRRDGGLKTVTVVIPVCDGALFLRDKLASIISQDYPAELLEIRVISDGSTDRTDAIAGEFASRGVHLTHIAKGGKAAAINKGIELATGEIVVMTDVRQELGREGIRRLVERFGDDNVGVVSGTLVIQNGATRAETDIGLYWRYETWIREQLGKLDSMFGATGPFYAIRRSLAVPIPPNVLLDDMYLPLAPFFLGYRLVVEETAKAFDYPTTLETEFRRKVRTLAGVYQLMGIFPQLLVPGNRMWFHFVSYKVGRLLLPFALMVVFACSFFLPEPWRVWALGFQGVFYGIALLDAIIPQSLFLKRFTSPVRTFVVLVIAAFFAISIFFVPPLSLWKITKVIGYRGSS